MQTRLGASGFIECNLINVPLALSVNDGFEYMAVSYTWGSNEKTYSVEIECKRLPVTSNIYWLLNDLRFVEDESEYFWIDAICIDQEDDDNEEKSHQVQMMGEIYSQAKQVIIYLGGADGPNNILFSSLKMMDLETRGKYWPPTDLQWEIVWWRVQIKLGGGSTRGLRERQSDEFRDIIRNPWFYRVWIIQEVAKARAATVVYAGQRVSTRIFALAPRLVGLNLSGHQQAVFDLMPGPSRRYSWWTCGRDLYTLLKKFSRAEATVERDKIYALLGMCQDGSSNDFLLPSYKQSISEVIDSTAFYIYSLPSEFLPELAYTTISEFLSNIYVLDEMILRHLASSGNIDVLKEFLDNNQTVAVTDRLLAHIAQNEDNGEELMHLLFKQREQEVHFMEPILMCIARNKTHGKNLLDLAFRLREEEILITEKILFDAVINEHDGKEVMKLLLRKQPNQVHLIQKLVERALSNGISGLEIVQMVVDAKGGGHIPLLRWIPWSWSLHLWKNRTANVKAFYGWVREKKHDK